MSLSATRPTKPETAFDVCHDFYRSLRHAGLEPRARRLDAGSAPGGDICTSGPRGMHKEFLADFALCGERALASKRLASRLILFRVYYLGGAPWNAAARHCGLREDTFLDWCDEIRLVVGRRLMHARLFPIAEYLEG